MRFPFYAIFISFFTIVSCTVGPDYERPETAAQTPKAFQNAPDTLSNALTDRDLSRWWRRMDDPVMDRFVGRLLSENLQLKEAAARIAQAWAKLGIERGGRWPALSASTAATRGFQPTGAGSGGSAIPVPGASGDDRVYFTRLELGLSASWQVDLFGTVRRRIAAAADRYLASRAETRALVHALIAELARRRIALATLKRRLALTERTEKNRNRTLKTVELRYKRGTGDVSASDIYVSRENLSSVAADVPELRGRLAEEGYFLDVLLGYPPGTIDPFNVDMPMLPPPEPPPVGIPARLVDRRPDLRAAELRLIAASHDIGVAVADLYPNLTLNTTIGLRGDDGNTLFDTANLAGDIMGNLIARLFEGGRLRANVDLQEARARKLSAAYADAVLNALREVETALSNGVYLDRRIADLERSVESIRKAEYDAWRKYRRGLRPLLAVLDIQRRRYAAEQAYLLTAQAAWNNRIALYLALGGDWLEREPTIRLLPFSVESERS